MADRDLVLRDRLLMEAVALLYIVAIALAAHFSGWYYLLFPELGAVSHDVSTRPWGKWASQLNIPLSVTIGTGALTLAFLLYRWWVVGEGRAGESATII